MKLLRVHIDSAEACGGLFDNFEYSFHSPLQHDLGFGPSCLVGPNGSGKSQFLQLLAEIFQNIFYVCVNSEERLLCNGGIVFEIEYLIWQEKTQQYQHIKISNRSKKKGRSSGKPILKLFCKEDNNWVEKKLSNPKSISLLPSKIIGYSSGDNETLSLPFLISRRGYADEVANIALNHPDNEDGVPDTRLMLIDYGTHLEVLVANLLFANRDQMMALLDNARLKNIRSFRCVIQLGHKAAPAAPRKASSRTGRKRIQLTRELEQYIDNLRRCSTCHHYDEKTEKYIFDFFVTDQTSVAFRHFWQNAFSLYSSFHKLAMLNDLVISKSTRVRFKKEMAKRRFASRLPEPQDEDKVFRFERITFNAKTTDEEVDYVTLSDGEHQLSQILGIFNMVSQANVLFLLDEPESHYNPQWRIQFVSMIQNIPSVGGKRTENSLASKQECFLTSHAPFVPSDTPRERVFIFKKNEGQISIKQPDMETFGTNFDSILEECFDVHPPISGLSRGEIKRLLRINDVEEIKKGIKKLGHSVDKMLLADRLRQLITND